MHNLKLLISTGEGITILSLAILIAALAATLTALIEISQYGEEDTFYESH